MHILIIHNILLKMSFSLLEQVCTCITSNISCLKNKKKMVLTNAICTEILKLNIYLINFLR